MYDNFNAGEEPFPVSSPRKWRRYVFTDELRVSHPYDDNDSRNIGWMLKGEIPFYMTDPVTGIADSFQSCAYILFREGASKKEMVAKVQSLLKLERSYGIDVPIPLPDDWRKPQSKLLSWCKRILSIK